MRPVLYNQYRSSASFRVRIALALKGIDYDYVALHLRRGDQHAPEYRARNPQSLVPTLVWEDGSVLTQSLAICEFLEEVQPAPPILPADPLGRARVRAIAQSIAIEIQPLNNLRTLKALRRRFDAGEEVLGDWIRHWIGTGYAAIEAALADDSATGRFCHGDTPTLADICLVPQQTMADRFGLDMTPYPTVRRIIDSCRDLPAFQAAAPDVQPDAGT